jgi:hypothetical protein
VVCDVIDTLLSRLEAVLAETTLPREFGFRTDDTRFLIVIAIHAGVNVPEMLREVVFPKAGLHILDAFTCAEAASPRLAGVALFFISLPVALAPIALAALPCALVDLVWISAE